MFILRDIKPSRGIHKLNKGNGTNSFRVVSASRCSLGGLSKWTSREGHSRGPLENIHSALLWGETGLEPTHNGYRAHRRHGTGWVIPGRLSRQVCWGGINLHNLRAWVFAVEQMWAEKGIWHGASPLELPRVIRFKLG